MSAFSAGCFLTSLSSPVYSGRGGYHLANNILMPVLALLNSLLPSYTPFWKRTILLSISTKQSCKLRLRTGTSWFSSEISFCELLLADKLCNEAKFNFSWGHVENVLHGHLCNCEVNVFNKILSIYTFSDHASEVQVTMMLTESCKLRGLHHRYVQACCSQGF